MKKNYLFLFALMMYMQIINGQSPTSSSTSQSFNPKSYIGLRGGYLFKSKYANTNPMWHLKNGQFFELNAGTRINNSVFGFGAALGYLTIKRDAPKWESNSLNRKMIYDSITGGTHPIINVGLDDASIRYTKPDITEQYNKNFRGIYLLAGPEVWLGSGAFKVNAYLQGGISYNKVGYYYVEGGTQINDPASVTLTGPFGAPGGTRNYLMRGFAAFNQYGMSQKYYNKILTSGAANNAAAFALKEEGEIGFMAKVGVSAEYFVSPKISIHGGASYWYIGVPKMEGGQDAVGNITYFTNPGNLPTNTQDFSYHDPYSTKNLGYASANVGIKYWMGRSSKSATKTVRTKKTKCCSTCPVYALGITARDKYTKEVLPNTDVVIKNNAGEVVKTGRTNSFGVFIFEKILAEDYVISGLLNNVSLENSSIKKEELICDQVIQKEIIYTDRSFIIRGNVYECNSTIAIPSVSVILENTDLAYQKSTITDAQGGYMLKLPEAGIYYLHAKKDNFLSQLEEVTSNNYDRDKNLFVKLEICAERVNCDNAINLRNILFDIDKYAIKAESKRELNRLVQFMKDNPAVKVEVGSHTDCRNTDSYNQTLSENRAKASVDYVVSQGINRDRITGKGYGESKLLNKCADGVNCSEAEHAINRRTEMKVICP